MTASTSREREMRQKVGSVDEAGVLTPSVPRDIGVRSQRQRILAAMAKSCAEKTFSTTTIGDIVGRASISRGTFYKHFDNKRACFDAAAEDFLAELKAIAASAHPSDGSAVLEGLAARPALANLLLVEAPNVDPEIVRGYRDVVLATLEARWEPGTRAEIAGANPEIAFGRAKVLIADQLAAGRAKQLPSLLPELVYIALLPYVGQEAALEQARLGR
jgi:AcrR family transcriptional regulator